MTTSRFLIVCLCPGTDTENPRAKAAMSKPAFPMQVTVRVVSMNLAAHLLNRIARDPRLAYYFDPFTESMELLTAEYANQHGLNVSEFRKSYYAQLKYEQPVCQGECRKESR